MPPYGHLIIHLFDLFESILSRDATGFQKGRSMLNLRLNHGKTEVKNGSGSWIRTSDQVVNRVRVTLIFRSKPFSRHPYYNIKNIRDLSCLFKTKSGKKVGKFCFVDILMGLPKVDNPHFSTYLSEILHHNSSHDKRIFFYIVI